MARTYAEVKQQIAELEVEAEKLRLAEIAEVIEKIRVAVDAYGLTSDMVFGKGRDSLPKASKKKQEKAPSAAKYRDESGNLYAGRGPHPKWLREAIASGKSLEDFKV